MSVPNRLAGCLYGYAIGDAMGLGTEFMTRKEIAIRYPDGLREYSQIIRDAHRSGWPRGSYTHDTEIILDLIDSILANGKPDYRDFARRYKEWFDTKQPDDLEHHLRWILSDPEYNDHPHETAQNVYSRQERFVAPNEQLGRALVIGLWHGRDLEKNVRDNCLTTHADSRCVASALVIAAMANELLWHRREADFDRLWGICRRVEPKAISFLEKARDGRIEDFDLDDDDTYMSTLKTMGVALWALWHYKDPLEALYRVIHEGGDADTNGALALGLLGLKYGIKRLPADKIEQMVGTERIKNALSRLTPIIEAMIAQEKDDDE